MVGTRLTARCVLEDLTLQRRLKDHGCAFSDLINDVRRALVLRYLENPNLSLSHIADMFGFSMASSFIRWFINQFDMPPAVWRSAQKQSDTDAATSKSF
jgi:AraC-like DNA-binding protein